MKDSIEEWFRKIFKVLRISIYIIIMVLFAWVVINFILKNTSMPSFSWWSSTFLSDNYSKSIITEVEASGRNIRSVQFIDTFGRVCTSVYSSDSSGFDCDYPPTERLNWSMEDYKKTIRK